eukprot:TRINITY_DN63469_c0_g1_i1.p1 TRINITY_DN63469_c0_g1~~TRINITY_DN63469_c0_g1_i1.p1  ORF type:complete len:382 (-),score=77.28 TRINITY_DN63469_c0_g1_i1:208-1353(-)
MNTLAKALLALLVGGNVFQVSSININGERKTVGGISASSNSSADTETRVPRIYFLFMGVDKISNLDVWSEFFKTADSDRYRAFAHCKLQSCIQQLKGTPIIAVPVVGSYYCTDLVSPMNQLLNYALSTDLGPTNEMDKFAFVSDSSLPAKPFKRIYDSLTVRTGSDFCVFPPAEWADLPNSDGEGMEVAVKVHQWITLTRAHAERGVDMWSKKVMHNFMSKFHMNQAGWDNTKDNTFADSRNWGCLDEFWYMTSLFGTLKKVSPQGGQQIQLPGFNGSPLKIDRKAGWQGECDTFVIWAKYMHTLGHDKSEAFMTSLDKASTPHSGNYARPGWWDTISPKGIKAILDSDFLFMRKFIDKPTLAGGGSFFDAYKSILLNAPA